MGFLTCEKIIAKGFSSFSVTEPALAQVSLPSLSITKPLSAQMAQVLIFTVFPRPVLPKYCYLQCSRPCPGELAQPFRYEASECPGAPSIAIYSVPAPWAPQASLFTVSPPLPR